MTTEIRIEGLDKLNAKLTRLAGKNWAWQALSAAGQTIMATASPYPPVPTPKNPKFYYERGLGTVYVRADGSKTVYKTSEQLSKKWYVRGRGHGVEIGNKASYAPYVQGAEQTKQHKGTGWKRLDKTAEEHIPMIKKLLKAEAERIIGGG